MPCTWRTSQLRLLPILTVFLLPALPYGSPAEGNQSKLIPPAEDNTSLSVLVDTKVVLACPPVSLENVLIIRWDINLRGKPSCSRAYRRDNNETSERNCTDERISWESRPDLNPALQIGPVATTHEGYYRCEVAAQEGNFGLGYHLQVSVPPGVTLFRGSNGSIVCRAAAGKPAAQISWTPPGDCHTVEQQLGNGAVTVQSTCQWEDGQVSNVSCSVSHVTGNKSLSLELKPGDQSPLNLTTIYIISCISVIVLVILGSIWLWKIRCCRKCKLRKTEATSVVEEEEMQPYASYTEKNNPLYDTVTK